MRDLTAIVVPYLKLDDENSKSIEIRCIAGKIRVESLLNYRRFAYRRRQSLGYILSASTVS